MKCLQVATRFLSAVLLLSALAPCQLAWSADNAWVGPNLGNWTTQANWQVGELPDEAFNEAAVINNNTTVVVNTAISPNPAGVRIGTTAGNTGGLRIESGGTLNNVQSGAGNESGAIAVGLAGQGNLTVLGGGTLTGTSLSSAGATGSSITLGGTTASTATLTVTGTANLQRTTSVIGPNVNFNAGGNLTLTNAHTLLGEIRSATNHSPLKTDATANISGTFKPTFVGVTPAAGNKWTIIDAATAITGNFSSIDTSMAPALPAGQAYQTIRETAGARQLLRLSVGEILTLNVNRVTGAVSISNIGAQAKTIDGYSILSSHGSLTGTWNSLDDQNIGGAGAWVEAGPTPIALSELNPQSSSTLTGGGAFNLGTPYVKTFPAFGVDPDDISFEYSTPDGRTIQGAVVYSGTKTINNFVLNVDPATGQVAMRNDSPFNIPIDGYKITSASGSLTPATWNSLEDQNVADWEQAPPVPTANVVSELKADGATTFQGQTGFSLGALFKTVGATQDLQFEFLQAGNEVPTLGTVVYGPFTAPMNPSAGLTGDYNNNGTVDAADYVLWRNGGPLENDPTPGVQPGDYAVWRGNFGRTLGSGAGAGAGIAAVPEPTSALLMLLATISLGAAKRTRKS